MATHRQTDPGSGGRPPSPLPATVILVGGIDPGGGAGLLRDVATAKALGADPYAVGTAWTEQGDGIHRIEARAPAGVAEALTWAVVHLQPAAVKIGMAVSPDTAAAIETGLAGFRGPVVVDPVLSTSRGGPLWSADPRALLPLCRRATLVTPNASEAAALTGRRVENIREAEAAARALVERDGLAAVLVKGGHLASEGPHVTDVLVTASSAGRFDHRRASGPIPRGTGCALATATAVGLGRGQSLAPAIERAGTWLADAIGAARRVGGEWHLAG